jgi:hypothetical protein
MKIIDWESFVLGVIIGVILGISFLTVYILMIKIYGG